MHPKKFRKIQLEYLNRLERLCSQTVVNSYRYCKDSNLCRHLLLLVLEMK
jgi:hypothetical protein